MLFHQDLDNYFVLHSIDSTNMELQRRRKEFLDSNVLLISDEQTAGQGQQGRYWESKAGFGLWASLFLGRTKHLSHNLQLLSLYSGIIIQQAILRLTGIETALKWPNDIMINSRKCGGILTKLQWMGGTAKAAIIGIGINLLHQEMDFSPSLRNSATSLLQEGWRSPDRDTLVENIITEFFDSIELLNHPEHLIAQWNKLAWKLNKNVQWQRNQTSFKGVFLGVNLKGEALIRIGDKQQSFPSGELHWAGCI